MSVTQQQGVIVCIPKEGKDKSLLTNWRPVTLLNIPCKIASSCIVQRLKSVLPKLYKQKGFLKERFIGENIRPLCNTVFFIQVSVMYVVFSLWLTLRRPLTVWRGHLSESR